MFARLDPGANYYRSEREYFERELGLEPAKNGEEQRIRMRRAQQAQLRIPQAPA